MIVFCAEMMITGSPGPLFGDLRQGLEPVPVGHHHVRESPGRPCPSSTQRHSASSGWRSRAPCSPRASAPGSARCGSVRSSSATRTVPVHGSGLSGNLRGVCHWASFGATGSEIRKTVAPRHRIDRDPAVVIRDDLAPPARGRGPVPFSRPEHEGFEQGRAAKVGRKFAGSAVDDLDLKRHGAARSVLAPQPLRLSS